jgi:hypothetical protein
MLLKIDENSPNRSGKTSSGKHAHGAVAGPLSFVALQSLFPATTAANCLDRDFEQLSNKTMDAN